MYFVTSRFQNKLLK